MSEPDGEAAAAPPERAGLLLVMIDVEPEHEEEFNRWYEQEHLPERLACHGFISGRRFLATEGSPKYLAIYELTSTAVLETEDYRRLMQPPTPWTVTVTQHFTSVRNVYRELLPGDLPGTENGHRRPEPGARDE